MNGNDKTVEERREEILAKAAADAEKAAATWADPTEKKVLLDWVDDLESQVIDLQEEIARLNESLAGLPEMREEIDALRGRNTGFAGGTQGADEVPA